MKTARIIHEKMSWYSAHIMHTKYSNKIVSNFKNMYYSIKCIMLYISKNIFYEIS